MGDLLADFAKEKDLTEQFADEPEAYDRRAGTGKVYMPQMGDRPGVTETRIGGRLIAPSELGNTTGRPYEPQGPTLAQEERARTEADPGFLRNLGHQYVSGMFKGGSDEAVGALRSQWESGRPTGDTYRGGRNLEREILHAGEKHRPWESFAANVAGDVTTDAAAALLGMPVLSLPYQVATGGLRGLLSSDAELTEDKTTPEDRRAAATSTAVGAALPAALRVPWWVAKGTRMAGNALEKTNVGGRIANSGVAKWFQGATDDAGKAIAAGAEKVADAAAPVIRWPGEALDRASVALGRKVLNGGQGSLSMTEALSDDAVRQAIKEKVFKLFGTTEGASTRLSPLRESSGNEYGALVQQLKAKGVQGPEAKALADEWQRRAASELDSSLGSPVPRLYEKNADEIMTKSTTDGRLAIDQGENIKRSLQDQAKYGKYEETPLNNAKMDIAADVRRGVENEVDKATAATGDAELRALGEKFKPVKARNANLIEADNAAYRAAEQAKKRNTFSLRDTILAAGGLGGAGAAALGVKGAIAGPALALGSYFGRTRGPSTGVVLAKGLSDAYLALVNNAPQALGEFGTVIAREKTPEAQLAMTEALRMSSPKFAEMYEDIKQRLASRESPDATAAR